MFRRTIIISSLVMTLAGTAALAQGLRRNGGQGRQQIRKVERLQERLNLNEAQRNGIRALQETRRREMESLRDELHEKRQALRSLMQDRNPNPAEVGNATLALREMRQRRQDINQRFAAGVRGLLTPEQQQKTPKRLR